MLTDAVIDSPLAEPVVVNGQPVRAVVFLSVEMVGEYGQVVGHQTQIQISSSLEASHGHSVDIGAGEYLLDHLLSDDGQIATWSLRAA